MRSIALRVLAWQALAIVLCCRSHAQGTEEPVAPPTGQTPGTVLFSRDAEAAVEAAKPLAPEDGKIEVSDGEREALTFTAYDLDVHLKPADAGIAVRAALTVRNDSTVPLTRLALQLSSSLHWEAFSARVANGLQPLQFAERKVETDADHTGFVSEAVVTLAQPLAPGAAVELTALYSGEIRGSAERLTRIGAPENEAALADWDAIAASGTALRGFGDVAWYPVASAPVFLGDGAKLFQSVGRMRLREAAAKVRLRLVVDYAGDPPDAAFFCGRREQMKAVSDTPDLPVADGRGVATAEFAAQPLGFRSPSLFVTDRAATLTGPQDEPSLIAAVTDRYDALPAYSAAAALVEPLLQDWLGGRPMTNLTILDRDGQPFEDGALVVRPMRAVEPAGLAASLAHSLTFAWLGSQLGEHAGEPAWIDEGLAQFVSLLWTERTAGHAAVVAQLQEAAKTVALAEPADPDANAGERLAAATGDVRFRTKAAEVWWMLRGILGDDALKQAIATYRGGKLALGDAGLEAALEAASHKDLRWFFADWIDRDRGLPDLSIVSVTPRQLEARGGHAAGWLVAVDVRNDGYAVADVPITISGDGVSVVERLRIAGRTSASTRIVFAGTPDEVRVGDGSVPEAQGDVHVRRLALGR